MYKWLTIFGICTFLFVVLPLAIQTAGFQKLEQVYGDIRARFRSSISLDFDGKTWYYRDRQIVNVLVIGVDDREVMHDRIGYRSGGQADFLMLLAIDRKSKQITPIQIDRDTMAEIDILGIFGNPAGTSTAQICLAQAFGATITESCQNEIRAVSRLLAGIPIDYYVALDMSAIGLINDALGGITVTIEEDLSNLDPAMTAGTTLTLRGRQAETFVRSRMAVRSDSTNAGRMKRQRTYMLSAADKLTEQVAQDAAFGIRFLEQMGSHILTDLPVGWMTDQLPAFTKFRRTEPWIPAGEHVYGEDGFAEFYPDYHSQNQMLADTFFSL